MGVADLSVTTETSGMIVTFALGSCIGLTVYDPVAKVAGMLHFMLPSSKSSPKRAAECPAMFADMGIRDLFLKAYELGAEKKRMIVCAAGGAAVLSGEDKFRIGQRNRTVLRKICWQNEVPIAGEDTGGSISRTMIFDLATARVSVKHKGEENILWQP